MDIKQVIKLEKFKKILVFGGSGMVGSSLTNLLKSKYDKIRYPTRSEVNLFYEKQIEDYIEEYKPDLVINAAGKVGGILFNSKNNYLSIIENSKIGLNIVNTSFKCNVKNFINISSSCIYPNSFLKPISEKDLLSNKLEPTNEGYALSKILALKACEYIDKTEKEFNYKTVIPCNLFGPGDKFDLNNSHLIPGVINKIHKAKIENQKSVSMWGDGSARREFLYVDDLAGFIEYVIEYGIKNIGSQINVGYGEDFTVQKYYEMISNIVGFNGNISKDLTKPVGMKRKFMDNSLTKKMGWKPIHSMTDGIVKTYHYYLNTLV